MANSTISALTSATTPLAGTEVLPVVQSSATTQVSVANLTAGRSVSGSNFVVTGSTIPVNGVYLPAANSVGVATNSTLKTTVDASGNFGVGVVPSSWAGLTGLKAVEIAYVGNSLFNNNFSNFWLANNTYYNSGYKYANTGFASFYLQAAGTHQWHSAPSGTAGAAATFTQRMGLDTSSNLTINLGNIIQGTAAKGINFTANTPAAGMTSQLLNWYEEGTWTPTFTSTGLTVGYGTRNAQYVRVGSLVTASMYVRVTSTSGTLTNALTITGLPFAANATEYGSSGVFGVDQFITYRPSAFIGASQSFIYLYRAGTTSSLTGAELANGFYLLTITYRV